MKRFFNPIAELQFRFPQRFIPTQALSLPQGLSSQMVFMFALVAFFGCMMLFAPDTFATTLDDVNAKVTEIQGKVETIMATMLGAVIAIGVAAAAVFIASTIMKWFRGIA